MHPYSGGSKLASVSSRPDLQKGVQNEVKETPSRGKVEPPLPPHHQNFSTTPSIEISQLKKKKKKVLRVSAFSVGLVYGSWRLSSLKSTAAKAAAEKEKAASHGGGH